MKGHAIAYGAITIVNAMSIGKGAALGIDLSTEAEVEIKNDSSYEIIIEHDPLEDKSLAREAVSQILAKFERKRVGARVITRTNIPIARGLKSSSSAANAIVLATLQAIGANIDEEFVPRAAAEAAIRSGVSITGAFDDSCACHYGGFVVTDNILRKILRRERAPEHLRVALLIPKQKTYTAGVDVKKLSQFKPIIDYAFELALNGKYWESMTINGLVHAIALGYEVEPLEEALKEGAIAAGLTGKGPAMAAVCEEKVLQRVLDRWSMHEGQTVTAHINNRPAGGIV